MFIRIVNSPKILFKSIIVLFSLFICVVWTIFLNKSIMLELVFVIGVLYLLVLNFQPFWVTLAFVFTLVFGPLFNLPITTDGLLLSLVILFTAFANLIMKSILTKDIKLFRIPLDSPLHILIVAFFFFTIVSLINTKNILISLAQIKRLLYCVIIYFYMTYSIKNEKQLKKVLALLLIAYFLVASFGLMEAITGTRIYQYLGGKSLLGGSLPAAVLKISEKARIQGVIGNAEFHSFRMLSFFLLTLGTLFILKSKTGKILIGLSMLLALINVIGTAYRGAMITLSLSLFVFFVLSQFRRKWIIFGFSLSSVIALGIILYIIFPDLNIERLVKTEGKAVETVSMRKDNVLIGLQMALDKPIIGNGPDGFILQYHRYKHNFPGARQEEIKTHNTYIQILAEYGIIGLIIFLLILFITLKDLYLVFHSKTKKQQRYFILSILTVVFAHVTLMGGANMLLDHNFWLIMAVACTAARIYRENS